MKEVIEEVKMIQEFKANQMGIEVTTDYKGFPRRQNLVIKEEDSSNFKICTDIMRLQQIVMNLLSNALKFTPNGGQIFLTATLQGPSGPQNKFGSIVISVKDTGIGIQKKD